MLALLYQTSKGIDWLNEKIGQTARWLILVAVLVSSGNAMMRYTFSISSNAWLEVQWYLFAAVFLLCTSYAHLRNDHVRIDLLLYGRSERYLAWVDILGGIVFLLPMTILIATLSWPMFIESFTRNEISGDAGGLLRWPVKLLVPLGFFLLTLQGLSEIIKRIAFLKGIAPYPAAGVKGKESEVEELLAAVEKDAKL